MEKYHSLKRKWTRMQPIYLLADSQLLFWRDRGELWLQSVRKRISHSTPKAAYLGASNGDDPQFYAIFEAAMSGIGIRDCRIIRGQAREAQAYDEQARGGQAPACSHMGDSFLSGEDRAFIDGADLILLAGGDVEKGWNVFTAVGLDELIAKRYHEGAILMGISAGAIQLGMLGWGKAGGALRLFDTFKLVPFIIGAHEEERDWETLKDALRHARASKGLAHGIGIPTGGALIYTPQKGVKAIRRPLFEFSIRDGLLSEKLLIP